MSTRYQNATDWWSKDVLGHEIFNKDYFVDYINGSLTEEEKKVLLMYFGYAMEYGYKRWDRVRPTQIAKILQTTKENVISIKDNVLSKLREVETEHFKSTLNQSDFVNRSLNDKDQPKLQGRQMLYYCDMCGEQPSTHILKDRAFLLDIRGKDYDIKYLDALKDLDPVDYAQICPHCLALLSEKVPVKS